MPSSLVSYAKRDIFETIPGLRTDTYYLPASKDNIPSILHVDDSYYYKPDIEGRQDQILVSSEQIVNSIVHMHITSQLAYQPNFQHPAIFAIPKVEVTLEGLEKNYPDKIKESLARQRAWFIALVKIADDDWHQVRRHQMISDIQRMAARELGLTREWLFGVEEEAEGTIKPSCPFCGSGLLNPDAPICPVCHQVHNPERFAILQKGFEAKITEKRV